MTSTIPTPTLDIPPLAAIFLTHFHDTKGQSVIYYKSSNEAKLPRGTIEHTTLPSGLHLVQEDFFGFRHALKAAESAGPSTGKYEGDLPGIGLFKSRNTVDAGRGRGRRMATLGVVIADPNNIDDLFELRTWLNGVYDQIENDQLIIDEVPSSQPNTQEEGQGRQRLNKILDDLWSRHGSGSLPDPPRSEEGGRARVEKGLRGLADGRSGIPANHPIRYLPDLLDTLGPQFITLYKAAISGRRILIYSPPPLLPISAYGWCISALSLPPSAVPKGISQWLGQVGLMDLDGLKSRKGGWVASTSDKILLSHTKAYDLSIDLSTCNPLPAGTVNPDNGQITGQAEIKYTNLSSSTPILTNYQFSDIPLYKSLTRSGGPGLGSDWWLTIYDLVDRVWTICAGVCEYAVGRGQAGQVSLGDRGGNGEDDLLLPGDEDEDDEGEGQDEDAASGRMILRQLYHQTYHLHARLRAVQGTEQPSLSVGQVRELSGTWMVKSEDVQFWQDLNRHWAARDEDHE